MIGRVLPYIGKQSTGSMADDAKLVSVAIAELVEGLGHKSTLTQVCVEVSLPFGSACSSILQYNVPTGEEESIATHALENGQEHPDFDAGRSPSFGCITSKLNCDVVKKIVHALY